MTLLTITTTHEPLVWINLYENKVKKLQAGP